MRAVAAFAALLLALALAFEFEVRTERRAVERAEEDATRTSHTVRALSTGFRLKPATLGRRNAHQGIYVDDSHYNLQSSKGGLRVLTIPADDRTPELQNFTVFESDEAVGRLGNMLAGIETNTVLVIASHAFIGPALGKDDERRGRIGMLLRGLGATTSPEEAYNASFAFVCVRRPQGFVPIAETFSTTRGVTLAVHLERDLSVYDDREPNRVRDDRTTLALDLESGQGADLEQVSRYLDGLVYPAIRVSAPPGEPRGVTWDVRELLADAQPALGREAATFTADLGLLWDWRTSLTGARITLFVNGRERGERIIFREGEAKLWLAWEVLLNTESAALETVEVRVERLGKRTGPSATVLIANPALQLGRITSG